jgi:hypothetical protein
MMKLPELEKKVRTTMAAIASHTANVNMWEQRAAEIRLKMNSAEENAANFLELSVSSLRSTAAARVRCVEPASPQMASTKVQTTSNQFRRTEFPNFMSKELYQETPADGLKEEVGFEVDFGESTGVGGCCRSRFFCM